MWPRFASGAQEGHWKIQIEGILLPLCRLHSMHIYIYIRIDLSDCLSVCMYVQKIIDVEPPSIDILFALPVNPSLPE